jgi:ubiquinone/menaquinone biosynthesis C-methylase UbiE
MCASDAPRVLDHALDGLMAAHREALAPVTEALLSCARIEAGQRVLDVGSGAGELALLAARRVGPEGHVFATDVEASGLATLLESSDAAACKDWLSVRAVAAEDLVLDSAPFDVALARNCVMYFRDLPRGLASIRGVLHAGGRLVLSLYGPRQREPFHDVALAAVEGRHALREPLPQYAQAFRTGPAAVVTALAAAGFGQIEQRVVPTRRTYPTLQHALAWLRHSPSLGELMGPLEPSAREDAWRDIADGWRRYETAAGLQLPGEQVVIAARA